MVHVWESLYEIASNFNISYRQVRKMLFGEKLVKDEIRKTSKGYIWVLESKYSPSTDYVELCKPKQRALKPKPEKIYKPRARNRIKSISLQNIETQEVRNFASHIEAAKELGINKINFYYLNRGFRIKRGKKINITQWKGWKIVNCC